MALVLALVAFACQAEEAELTTTSSLVASPTTVTDAPDTTDAPPAETTTTTLAGQPVGDDYQIVARSSDPAGETLYIVIPPGAYTDVDIENFVIDLFEEGVATHGAEIFDDAAAVDAYLKTEAERTEADLELIRVHHFASLIDGIRIRFRGPFESLGETVIGS